ncbi:RHS repeat-associated core domain-containing protein, partial [Desulfovibrio sp. Huiquan2017]|uniref:RHS repeat-associated core domain-containing protein n=1 Tax=Desulfovibrio sp. Huiquan2017 TaxID=2816861 RepID=UPI002570D172
EVLYDPLGGIIADTNPGLRVPIGFAGGLHDRDLGFVRFGWRDYDTFTGRWTAPDPIGDRGGDPDWYGYCLDDPVNGVDPLGLFDITAGDAISTGVTVGIEGLKQAGKISPVVAGGLGVITAPLADWISPSEAGEGEDYILWKKEAAEKGWLDALDTEEAIRERERYGKASYE